MLAADIRQFFFSSYIDEYFLLWYNSNIMRSREEAFSWENRNEMRQKN